MYRPKKISTRRPSFLQEDLHHGYLKILLKINMLVTQAGSVELKSWKGPGSCEKVPLSGSKSHLWLRTIGLDVFLDNRQKRVAS